MKAYYYGDVRLWKTGIRHEVESQRRLSMTFDGVDQDDALVLASAGSWTRRVTCFTFFDQHPSVPYTQRGFRALLDEMHDALIARSAELHPLIYVLDDSAVPGVQSYVGGLLTTTADHGLIVGDRILVRRLGDGLYTYAAVATVPNTDEVTLSTVGHAIAGGDDVLLAETVWPECRFNGMDQPQRGRVGDYYGEEVGYSFDVADSVNIYHRTSVDLDA